MQSEKIKKLRAKHSITQEQLASILGVSFTTVNAWETGKRQPQHSMQELLEKLSSESHLQNFSHLESHQPIGMNRSNAGFISTVISYDGRRDDHSYTHGIGRWYGNLPSFLVRDIVKFCGTDLDSPKKSLVNFCGSGTVPLEFGIAGIKSYGIDVNPVAFFLSYIKTQAIAPLTESEIKNSIKSARKTKPNIRLIERLDEDNLLVGGSKWISPAAKASFLALISFVNKSETSAIQIILIAALINSAIDFCQIDKRCTNHYVFLKKEISQDDFWSGLEREALKINFKLKELKRLPSYVKPELSLQDNRITSFKDSFFDVIFSHPPYGNMINYYSMSRVQLSILNATDFIDKTLSQNVSKAINAVQKMDQSASTIDLFNRSISDWIKESSRVLKINGHLIVVIGDGRNKGFINHPHTEIIHEAELNGMRLKELFVWITENKSGMHVRRKGHHIDHNYVIILKKVAQ